MLLPLFCWSPFNICDFLCFTISSLFLTLSLYSLRPLAQFLPYMTHLIFLPTCSRLNTPLNVYSCLQICMGCMCVHACAFVCVCVRLFCGRMWSALIEVNQRNPRVHRSNSIAFIDQATFSASVPSLCSFKLSPSLAFLQLLCTARIVIYSLLYSSAMDLLVIAAFLFKFWL